jgi:hypothetical protein
VKELGFPGEEDLAKEVIETSIALAPGILKVLCVEGSEMGSNAEMLGEFHHGVKQRVKRVGQPLEQSRSNGENLRSFGIVATAAHSKTFIETHAKHRVGSFKAMEAIQIGVGIITFTGMRQSLGTEPVCPGIGRERKANLRNPL